MAKDVGPGQLLAKYGFASYRKHRIVAYSAYIFKNVVPRSTVNTNDETEN